MTEKQKNLIVYLDFLCEEKKLKIRASNDDMLGRDWYIYYKSYTPTYTSEVINKLKTALGMEINEAQPKKGGKK